MKAHKNWSYTPYRPPFIDCGDIYICRLAPTADRICVEWLPLHDGAVYTVWCRERGSEEFAAVGETAATEFTVCGLSTDTDYELRVTCGEACSRIRLARCAETFGSIVNYLHPEDPAYAFSGKALCSPSLVRHPDGFLLASMDVFAGNYPQNLSLIFRSDDNGNTWHYVSELFPCFWGKLFIHNGELYMLACSTEYGDLLIGKSTDGGKTFGEPTVLLRGGNGKNGEAGVHKNPQPVVYHDGRIWNTLEWGSWGRSYHAPMVMSAPADADLLDADSWSFSEPIKYDPTWKGVPAGPSTGNIEGCPIVVNGTLYNIMRYDMGGFERKTGLVTAYKVDSAHPEAPLIFDRCIEMPTNACKFEIKYHEPTGKFYSLATCVTPENAERGWDRRLIALMASDDCEHWEVLKHVIDYRHCKPEEAGFQYIDFIFDGNRILYLCRSAMNKAANFHDANYSIFDVIDLDEL